MVAVVGALQVSKPGPEKSAADRDGAADASSDGSATATRAAAKASRPATPVIPAP